MINIPVHIQAELNIPYDLTSAQIAFYKKHQFIKLKQILSEEALQYFNDVISEQVALMNKEDRALEERST
jgi:hypothetical protein